jgi:Domain of unknown function (DUF4404)
MAREFKEGGTMSDESLRSLVERLRSELGKAHGLDADIREGLHSLAHEVEGVLQAPGAGSRVVEPRLRDRLADRVRELEASHPKLAETIGNIVETLAFYNL